MSTEETRLDQESVAAMNDIWDAPAEETPAEDTPPVEETPAEDTPPADTPPAEDTPPATPEDQEDALLDQLLEKPGEQPPVVDTPPQAPEPVDPDGLDPKQKHAWGELKFKLKQAEQKVRELEVQRQNAPDPKQAEEADALRIRLEQAEERIGRLDITQTQAFQQSYDQPIQAQLGKAARLMVLEGATEDEARALSAQYARAPYATRKEAVNARFPEVAGALIGAFAEVDTLAQARSEAVKNWKDTRAALETRIQSEQRSSLVRQLEQTTAKVISRLAEERNILYTPMAGREEWNREVESRKEAVRGLLRDGNPEELTYFIARGVGFDRLETMLRLESGKRKALAAELARLRGSNPDLGAGGGRSSGGAPDTPRTNEAVLDRIWS